MKIYERAFKVLMKKPLKLWGITLLYTVLTGVLTSLCGVAIPALGVLFALALVVVLIAVLLFGNLFMGLVQAAFYEEINKEDAFCAGCGARLDDGAKFCASCGKSVE